MSYYVVHIQTGLEKKFLRVTRQISFEPPMQILWPRRTLKIRKDGQWKNRELSIFPGYLFLEAEILIPTHFDQLRRITGFLRFLQNNQTIIPLSEEDTKILCHFLSFGEIVGNSQVSFNENNQIIIKSGPLKGLEGHIIKVDRRKKRVKISLMMYKNSFLIDFGFEAVAPVETPLVTP